MKVTFEKGKEAQEDKNSGERAEEELKRRKVWLTGCLQLFLAWIVGIACLQYHHLVGVVGSP